jgi:hypothetical protein
MATNPQSDFTLVSSATINEISCLLSQASEKSRHYTQEKARNDSRHGMDWLAGKLSLAFMPNGEKERAMASHYCAAELISLADHAYKASMHPWAGDDIGYPLVMNSARALLEKLEPEDRKNAAKIALSQLANMLPEFHREFIRKAAEDDDLYIAPVKNPFNSGGAVAGGPAHNGLA